jgi:hypothetical protein
MRIHLLLPLVLSIMLLSACATRPGEMTWTQRWGSPAQISGTTRTITISPDTRYVNVIGGEVVKFVEADRSFGWSFDGQLGYAFELNQVAPSGILDHKVMAYVDPDPYYNGR